MKKVILSQRISVDPETGETRDALDSRLCELVIDCGAAPFPIPNQMGGSQLVTEWFRCLRPDAILFSGGQDFGCFPHRDNLEFKLLELAAEKLIPTLGICRGMQLLVKREGGELEVVAGHVGTSHKLSGHYTHTVNSFHTLSPTRLPKCFEVLASTNDNHIEAIRHKELPFEGWMWHPERSEHHRELHLNLIKDKLQI